MTREQFQEQLQRIKGFRTREDRGFDVLQAVTWLLEQVIQETFAEAAKVLPEGGEEIAILATGGFGRRELHPHSDVDIIILFG
ncbi:MAG: hypothetical protein L0312_29280, partial [Acidobacteria bacterium]|nr:hypothetical protein [Acidobacteriota bacterium]